MDHTTKKHATSKQATQVASRHRRIQPTKTFTRHRRKEKALPCIGSNHTQMCKDEMVRVPPEVHSSNIHFLSTHKQNTYTGDQARTSYRTLVSTVTTGVHTPCGMYEERRHSPQKNAQVTSVSVILPLCCNQTTDTPPPKKHQTPHLTSPSPSICNSSFHRSNSQRIHSSTAGFRGKKRPPPLPPNVGIRLHPTHLDTSRPSNEL